MPVTNCDLKRVGALNRLLNVDRAGLRHCVESRCVCYFACKKNISVWINTHWNSDFLSQQVMSPASWQSALDRQLANFDWSLTESLEEFYEPSHPREERADINCRCTRDVAGLGGVASEYRTQFLIMNRIVIVELGQSTQAPEREMVSTPLS